MGHINKSSKLQKYGFLSFVMGARIFKSNSSVRQGAQIFRPIDFELLTSQIKKAFAKHNGLVALQLLAVLAGGFLSLLSFGNSAYAASYVNVSSGGSGDTAGVVSLGKIKPSSSGSTATGNDTLTVHTDCSAGYKVYVSGQNGKTTNLTNQSAEDPTNPSSSDIISASSNTIASPNTLSSNTWGISGSSTDIENHLYAGLPAYADSTNVALVTKTNVEEESTVPIYYGVNANTAINPGTYKGDILYTVLMDSSCVPYTVEFNPNVEDESEITGEMTNQSIMPNTSVTLNINTYERNGYFLLGWAEEPEGKTGTVTNGVGTEADIDYIDGEEITNVAIGGTTKTLYAIWAVLDGEMQNFAGCSTLSDGDVRYLKDLRDGTAYRIKKIGDECWMTKNLILGYDKGYALTSELTNIPANDDGTLSDGDTYYLPQAGYRGALDSSTTDGTTTFNGSNDSQAQVQYRAAGNAGDQNSHGILSQSTGYYNFYAATLGCSYYQDGNSNCYSGYTPRDICPKGWQLPAGGSDATKSWVSLDETLNSSSAGFNRTDIVARDKFLNDARFVYSGGYDSYQLFSVGMHGTWRSSTVSSSDNSYYLLLDSSGYVGVQDNRGKYLGFAVRCVAQSHYTIAYNANSGTGTAPASQSVVENGGVTTQVNTFTRDGYNFLGWSTNASATVADYPASSAQNVNDIVSAAATSGQTTTDGSTITLYAVWEEDRVYLQTANSCSTIPVGTTGTLTDSRDKQEYTIYRFKDTGAAGSYGSGYPTDMPGYCIMTKDLSLGYVTGGSVTKGSDLTLTTDDSAAAATITARTNLDDWSTDGSNSQYTNGTGGNNDSHSYYSFNAAQKVCPKGWRLPTNSEYQKIISFMGGNTSAASTRIRSTPYSFIYGGRASSSWGNVGNYGYYWSSTENGDNSTGYVLYYNSSSLNTGYSNRIFGSSVRCVSGSVTIQETVAGDLPIAETSYLKDTRDDQEYSVYRWPSTGTAGTDYPTSMSGYAIMTKDLSLGYVTGGSVTEDSDLTLTTSDSVADATIVARTDKSNWSTSYSDSNLQYINNTYSYYSYGAAQKVCPKGWRLPTNSEHSNIISFMGGNGSTGRLKIANSPYNFNVSGPGYFYSGGLTNNRMGYYWSSTQYDSSQGYALKSTALDMGTLDTGYFNKSYGMPVRCISAIYSLCLAAGTKIQTTMSGDTKPIEDIKVGDTVVSYDPDHQEYYMTEVIDTVIHDGEERTNELVKVTLTNGVELKMTRNHPILTTKGYKAIQNDDYETLTEDDIVITTAGEYGVSSIDIYATEPTVVYNFTVKGRDGDIQDGPTHSYVANGVVTHNVVSTNYI